MQIRRTRNRKTVLVLDDRETEVLAWLVDYGFDDFFRFYCLGNRFLKSSRIAAAFLDNLSALMEKIKNSPF